MVIDLLEYKARKEAKRAEMQGLLEKITTQMKGGGIGKLIVTDEMSLDKLLKELGIYE
jgi:hypothetical protein